MTTRQKLIDACKFHGIMLLDSGDCVRTDAPRSYVYANTGHHSSDIYTDGWKREDVYKTLLADVDGGLVPCTDPDCDNCVHEKLTFNQIQELYRGERLA